MRSSMRWLHCAMLAALAPCPAVAQAPASFRGVVRDAETGDPVRRAYLWLGERYPVRGTPDGHIEADSVPAGRYRLRIGCASRDWSAHVMVDEEVVLAPGEQLQFCGTSIGEGEAIQSYPQNVLVACFCELVP